MTIHENTTYKVTVTIDGDKVNDQSGIAMNRTFYLKGTDLLELTNNHKFGWTAIPVTLSNYSRVLHWLESNTQKWEG